MYHSYSMQGKRESNEDFHFISINNDGSDKNANYINLLCVFDGHGGKGVSKYLKENLPGFFTKKYKKNIFLQPKEFIKHVYNVCNLLQKELEEKHPKIACKCGSTACIIIHYHDAENKKNILWSINIGDSRAVLANKNSMAVQLTKDHKPNSPDERKRIEHMGGKIEFDGCDWRIKGLSLSRAIGDTDCKPYVICEPQINIVKLSSYDRFIIIGCDGLWDVINNQDAIEYVQHIMDNNKNKKINYAKALCEHAYKLGSLDNITVIVYLLN
jgi:serine/threonine protein phosphatase PrpC